MKKLFLISLLLLSGCATTPKETKVKSKTVCDIAHEYVDSLDAYFLQTNKPVKVKLEYCTEMRGHMAYFTYSMLTDVGEIKAASEVHFFAILKNVDGRWMVMEENPLVGDINLELEAKMKKEKLKVESL